VNPVRKRRRKKGFTVSECFEGRDLRHFKRKGNVLVEEKGKGISKEERGSFGGRQHQGIQELEKKTSPKGEGKRWTAT